ncbi:MAG: peptidase T [Mucilaginibacter polytrichastri]|nr:peptidase T [Mucilaginibacter polytrichastri]
MALSYTVKERFLRYVQIDTQSDPSSQTVPSTEKQKDLGRLLVNELLAMGVADAHLDDHGYVYATIPGTTAKNVPVICFCSHMDTSPDCSGKDVRPIVHEGYDGRDLVLPDDQSVVIRQSEHPDLKQQLGNDIITASGTTLLGADNKAGVAAIMDACVQLLAHPEWEHGNIRILFTPDEEIGRGVDHADLEKLGAEYAYTIDGESAGTVENETFSADGAVLTIRGISAHPGFAKGHMQSALKIAARFLASIPENRSPEHTEGKEGFIHPLSIKGDVEEARIDMIFRAFEEEKLEEQAVFTHKNMTSILEKYPGASYTLDVKPQYRNMKTVLDQHPQVSEYALEAVRRAGMEPRLRSIRGGTDGSRLSLMGLPCPNIFAGEHAFHGKQEWVSVQDMQTSVDTIVHLARIWAEKTPV